MCDVMKSGWYCCSDTGQDLVEAADPALTFLTLVVALHMQLESSQVLAEGAEVGVVLQCLEALDVELFKWTAVRVTRTYPVYILRSAVFASQLLSS